MTVILSLKITDYLKINYHSIGHGKDHGHHYGHGSECCKCSNLFLSASRGINLKKSGECDFQYFYK